MSRARDIANYGDGIDTSSITSGTLADARIPNLATSKITSGTFADARIAQSNVTQHESAIDALGTVASGTFNGTVGSSSTFNDGISSANISQFTAKAWVYWDGYTSPVVRNSFNCTLTRVSSGSFYITFTNNMSNVYYCVFAQGQVSTAYPQTVSVTDSSKGGSRSGTIYFNENGTITDPWTAQILVFGD